MKYSYYLSIKRCLSAACLTSILCMPVRAAEDNSTKNIHFDIGADFVSSYVWRGMYQTGASIQPKLGFSMAGFRLETWASTDFADAKEIDMTASYTFGETGLNIQLSDMWWSGQGANNYFNFKHNETEHNIEAGITYELPFEKIPLSISWFTFVYGADKDAEGNQDYSSYLELAYPFSVKQVEVEAALGVVPFASALYETNGFSVTNVSLTASHEIPISKYFALPIFIQAAWNPQLEDAHVVFGFTLAID